MINPLGASDFPQGRLRWHNSRNILAMLVFIVLLPLFGSLLGAIRCAFHLASDTIETARLRESDLS